MYWKFRKLNYEILTPKLEKSIYELNEEEAASYFDWYMEHLPERVSYVSKVCAKDLRISEDRLDCSPESLLLIWKWFRHKAKTEPTTSSGEHDCGKVLVNMQKRDRKMTLETEYILRDIGMYWGETFCKNNPGIYWSYYTKPRRDFFVNHPLLMGFVERSYGQSFKASFEPIHMAGVQAAKIISKTSKDSDLLTIYNIWASKV